jgi:hypothetical protein
MKNAYAVAAAGARATRARMACALAEFGSSTIAFSEYSSAASSPSVSAWHMASSPPTTTDCRPAVGRGFEDSATSHPPSGWRKRLSYFPVCHFPVTIRLLRPSRSKRPDSDRIRVRQENGRQENRTTVHVLARRPFPISLPSHFSVLSFRESDVAASACFRSWKNSLFVVRINRVSLPRAFLKASSVRTKL